MVIFTVYIILHENTVKNSRKYAFYNEITLKLL